MKQCKCGSYAFNLYKEDIDQGDLCDVHYWRALAKPEQGEPVAVVTGVYGGRFIVEPTNSAMVLPVNMALYAHPQPRKPKVTSNFIRKGIEASRLNVELLSALSACLDWMEQLRTSGDAGIWVWQDGVYTKGRTIEAKLKKNT